MKIRYDFVTNSSSTSYIIAVHKDFNKKEFDEIIKLNKEIIEENAEYYDITTKEAIEEIQDNFLREPDLKIGDWNIYGGQAGNDFDYFYASFLYNIHAKDTEHFKMRFTE